jgi:hypothetical protein
MLVLFAVFGWLREQSVVYNGLGFAGPSDHAALLVFGLLAAEALFPVAWLLRRAARADELAADRFAARAVGNGHHLGRALIGLTRQNLSSPGSHWLYRAYRNTHPALKERLAALRATCEAEGLPCTLAPSRPSPGDEGEGEEDGDPHLDRGQVDSPVAPEGEPGEDQGDGQDPADTDLPEREAGDQLQVPDQERGDG